MVVISYLHLFYYVVHRRYLRRGKVAADIVIAIYTDFVDSILKLFGIIHYIGHL